MSDMEMSERCHILWQKLPRTFCQNQLRGKRTEGSAYRSHHFPQARQELAKEGYGKETGLILSINRGD